VVASLCALGFPGTRDYNAAIPAVLLLALVTTASPAHAAVFAPPARASLYAFATAPEGLDDAVAYYRTRWPSPDPRSWQIERTGPLEVFDGAALVDRARLAQLYGGKPVRVARGPITDNGRVTHTVLLMSPYPDPELRRLDGGTLIMTVAVPQVP
jgi:hypothetical protein